MGSQASRRGNTVDDKEMIITKPLTPRMQLRNFRAYPILQHESETPVAEVPKVVTRAGSLVSIY